MSVKKTEVTPFGSTNADEPHSFLEQDLFTKNQWGTLVIVGVKGQPIQTSKLETGLKDGSFFYKEINNIRQSKLESSKNNQVNAKSVKPKKNDFVKRITELKKNNSREELEKYGIELGLEDVSAETYPNITLLAEAVVRKENDLPDDFDFGKK